MTNCERVETTIRKRQLWLAGSLVRQKETRLPRRIMDGRLTTSGPKGAGRPPKRWEDNLQDNLRTLGAVPRKGAQRKWFVYGVEVKDAYDWVTAAKNEEAWYAGVERGGQEFEDAWRLADKRESDRRHKQEAAASRAANRRIPSVHSGC